MTDSNSPFSFIYLCLAIAMVLLTIFKADWNPSLDPMATASAPTTAGPPPQPATPVTAWPDYSANGAGFVTPAGADGDLIADGYKLVAQTFAVIGPEVADASKRFAGNNLACQSCHFDGGTNRAGLPLVGVFKIYPKFSTRSGKVISLAERINECMTRSMNGRELSVDSREMAAFLAYMRYIGEPTVVKEAAAPPAGEQPSAARGEDVYDRVCAACHQPNGLGLRLGSASDARGYQFPPLWGPDSFNDGAGMDSYKRAVGFIQHNMPRGVDPAHPQLTLQEAWDVTAFLQSKPRPHYKPAR